ncbi:hypothetical protein [Marinomonas sp. TW1]|uniref:hypothetical protein n=1 Tax=Marinomonas sp. TW1 TaxID=1561203 RepID=UPI0007AF8B3B|nr:hypothetical protein [Marinomonas sp. TW1]KZN13048.1 hypothetical protein OA79_12915 [Marinomonas sp. TW1]
MSQLIFRLCEASDGRIFACLSDQPNVEDVFDSGYKVAYKNRDNSNGTELLASWRSSFIVKSAEFNKLPEDAELPAEIQSAFDTMMASLIKGVDVFFCDYNLGIQANAPICNNIMDNYKSTDFVLFSCEEMIGNDPRTQPYLVSYAAPRYPDTGNIGRQHRIYSKTDAFAFCQAVHAIVVQREKDALTGGHIRTELDPYINQENVEKSHAENAINQFVKAIQHSSGTAQTNLALAGPEQ